MSGFDPQCRDLAEYFLPKAASERLKVELAQHIQDAIEDWIRGESARLQEALGKPKTLR